jgi:RimJ/RimL family protein N-acetyltransferase
MESAHESSPLIHTERLTLRAPRVDDAAAIFDSYARDPEVTRYLVWTPHRSVAETEEYLRGVTTALGADPQYHWAVTERGDDTARGMIALRRRGHKADFGYVLARRLWGRGYMTEALRAVLAFAFTLPGLYRVWAVCDVENAASARVMEKAGLRFEGVLCRDTIHPNIDPEPRDVRCYAITR